MANYEGVSYSSYPVSKVFPGRPCLNPVVSDSRMSACLWILRGIGPLRSVLLELDDNQSISHA